MPTEPAAIAVIVTVIGLLLTICGGIAKLAWWLSTKFVELKEEFSTKLELHSKDVDRRFELSNNRIAHIELRNAAVDGRTTGLGGIELP